MGTRNVVRGARRSLLAGTMLAIGVAAIVFFRAYVMGLRESLFEAAIEGRNGALQVQRKGYAEAIELAPLDLDVPVDASVEERLERTAGVAAIAPRLRFMGLLSNGETATDFVGTGVDPRREKRVCPRSPVGDLPLAEGFGLEGPGLQEGGEDAVILPIGMARSLHLKIGDPVTLQAQTRAGSLEAIDAVVRGIFHYTDPLENKRLVVMPLGLAQRLLHMSGRATAYAVGVRDRARIEEVAATLRGTFAGSTPPLAVHTWAELDPYYRGVIDLQDDVMQIVTLIVFAVALAGVVNTMMMSVFERQREVGTLMALGFRRRAILGLFLVEALTLGAIASLVGTTLGWWLVRIGQWRGMPFPIPAVGTLISRPILNLRDVVFALAATLAAMLAAGLYPALRASRLSPVEALHAD